MLDRLVDGELSDEEYRELLGSLDSHAEGWRRCAMAFLESQALERELRALRSERPNRKSPNDAGGPSRSLRRWTWSYGGLLMLASAASFLLAFVIASQVMRTPAGGSGFPNSVTGGAGSAVLPHLAGRPGLPSGEDAIVDPMSEEPSYADERPELKPWGEYRLVVDGQDGQPREIQMPIFNAEDPRAWQLLLDDDQAPMPEEVVRAFERMGYQIDRQRHWAPVQHAAGDVLVPIDQMQITPVSTRSYQ